MAYKATPLTAPRNEAAAVTPADGTDLPGIPEQGAMLYIGVAGDVKVDMALGGTAIVFKAVPVGFLAGVLVKKVYSTGTTATNIVACW